MDADAVIEQIERLSPSDRRKVEAFLRGSTIEPPKPNPAEKTLHQLLADSPFADLDFSPTGIRAPVREVGSAQ